MNILYLNSHDTGRAIQPYGYPVSTPNLQALAESGTLFRHAHCVAPTCSPSRAGLLTGQNPHSAGMVGLAHRGGRLLHPERHLAAFLADHGFETVRAGLTHVGNPDEHGYTVQSGVEVADGDAVADFAVNYLRNAPRDRPFYLDVGFFETHRNSPPGGFSRPQHHPHDGEGNPGYVMSPPGLPDTPEIRRDWLDYRHSVERLDRYYGRILDALSASGLADNTLVLATTDHGLAFPGMKCSLTHHGTGVYLILRVPDGRGGGRVIDDPVCHLDWYPTVCELLGLEAPAWLEGTSLLPSLDGASLDREFLFSEVTFHAAFEPKRAVRSRRWLYIWNAAAPHAVVLPNCDDGHAKRFWLREGYADRSVPPEELYDLTFDPGERNNLAEVPALAAIKSGLRARLQAWMEETADPLLNPDPAALPEYRVNGWEETEPSGTPAPWDPEQWRLVFRPR